MNPSDQPEPRPLTLPELVAELKEQPRQEATLSREIVRLARAHRLTLAQFRSELRAGQLDDSRISEFVGIFEDPTAAEEFTRERNPLSFRAALRLARGQPASSAAPAKSAETKLPAQADQLLTLHGTAAPWVIQCGLYQLRFVPGASAETEAPPVPAAAETLLRLVIPLDPDTETALAQLSKRSGIARAKCARELLERAPWADLLPATTGATPAPTPPAKKMFLLSRRKNPARRPEAVCRLPVPVSVALADKLTALGATLGLSRVETANLLLEPDPRQRVQEVRAALASTLQARMTECGTPTPKTNEL
jgi:hypothetical protein